MAVLVLMMQQTAEMRMSTQQELIDMPSGVATGSIHTNLVDSGSKLSGDSRERVCLPYLMDGSHLQGLLVRRIL
jgi:hypothetical protein